MRFIATTAAASLQILADDGTQILAYSLENAKIDLDLSTALKAVSGLSHLFKALDATHNVSASVNVQGESEHKRVGTCDRLPQVQELIDAVRRFKSRTSGVSVELTTEQHDGYMALADALASATDDANARNVAMLAERAKAYVAMFDADKFVIVRTRLIEAIAAV